MAKKKPAKRNPTSRDTTNYWLGVGFLLTLGVAAFGLKYMSDADRKKVIGV